MNNEISKDGIYKYLVEWKKLGDLNIKEEGHAFSVTIRLAEKKIKITTPYEVAEFFVDFYVEGKAIYSDWFEAGDDETLESFMGYSELVVSKFLNNNVRVEKKGKYFFKYDVLEFESEGQWFNIFT